MNSRTANTPRCPLLPFLVAACLLPVCLPAQKALFLSGQITDAFRSDPLPFATIEIPECQKVATTDDEGEFAFAAITESDSVTVRFSRVGYKPRRVRIHASGKQSLYFSLEPEGRSIPEVVIEDVRPSDDETPAEPSATRLSIREMKSVPALLGETDILKVLQLKPGVVNAAEGSVGFSVRGGSADQNLILLDNATVYNAAHLFGFVSNFNAEVVRDLTAHRGGFPSQFGGRLSSIVSVRTSDGDFSKTHVSGGIGLLSTRLKVEGPIRKDKISWSLGGRRTYVDLVTRAINKRKDERERLFRPVPSYDFHDLNGRLSFRLSPRNQLAISGFWAEDNFSYKNLDFDFRFRWQNTAASAQWTYTAMDAMAVQTTLSHSSYWFNIQNAAPGFSVRLRSGISDWTLKSQVIRDVSATHRVRFGGEAALFNFNIGQFDAGSTDGQISLLDGSEKRAAQLAFFGSDERKITDWLRLNAGLRLSGFASGRTFFGNVEPRLMANFPVSESSSFSASFARMSQYLHQLAGSSGVSFPTDFWYPSTRNVRPQLSDQISLGFAQRLAKGWNLNWEIYHKWLRNQIELRDGALIVGDGPIDQQISIGNGRAFAATELELEKTSGPLTGWVGYTLAWVQKGGFADINGGRYFSPRHDVRHNLTTVGTLRLNRQFSVSSTLVYRSGIFAWLPSGKFTLQNVPGGTSPAIVPVYGERNTFQFPHYFRLDFAFVWHFMPRRGQQDLTLSVYNLTNRRNPYFYYFSTEYQTVVNNGHSYKVPQAVKISPVNLFPILPSLTWNFKF